MKSIWLDLLEYARWTPSPHNVQAWKLKIISETEADLYYEPKRLLPVTDPTGCFSVMGFAMFIDSLSLAANAQGLKVEAKYQKKDFDFKSPIPVLFANLKLVPTSEKESLDKELIKKIINMGENVRNIMISAAITDLERKNQKITSISATNRLNRLKKEILQWYIKSFY